MAFQATVDFRGLLFAKCAAITVRLPFKMLLRIIDIKILFHHRLLSLLSLYATPGFACRQYTKPAKEIYSKCYITALILSTAEFPFAISGLPLSPTAHPKSYPQKMWIHA
jgi:hypothetical protein